MRYFFLMFCFVVVAGSKAGAEVVVYKSQVSGGIQRWQTELAASKRWNVACKRQVSGKALGSPSCVLEPWSGDTHLRSGVRISLSKGIAFRLDSYGAASVSFIPPKLYPNSKYSISCGDVFKEGVESISAGGDRPVFRGSDALDLLHGAMTAGGCIAKFRAAGDQREYNGFIQTVGLTDAVSFSSGWLGTYFTN